MKSQMNRRWIHRVVGVALMLALAPAAAQKREGAKFNPLAPHANIAVMVDAPCVLKVNGERVHTFNANSYPTYPVWLNVGTQRIECVSTKDPSIKAEKVMEVVQHQNELVTLRLKTSTRWQREGGTLIDVQSNLQWTARDNGVATSWRTAREHCARQGNGWRLPTADELLSLYDPGELGVECTDDKMAGTRCRVHEGFRLSSWYFWSADNDGSSKAWGVELNIGRKELVDLFFYGQEMPPNKYSRALCVRRA